MKPKISNLKLFVWDEEYCRSWKSGLAVAIAENETDAKALVEAKRGFQWDEWGPVKVYPISPIAFEVGGGD